MENRKWGMENRERAGAIVAVQNEWLAAGDFKK
jgi:hypothetical protein